MKDEEGDAENTPYKLSNPITSTLSGSSVVGPSGSGRSNKSINFSSKAMYSHRIVSVDFYTSAPLKDFDALYSEFRLSEVSRVPVLRIFGSTPKGQKTCAHIHGVFPYITILSDSSIENMERRISVGIDQALNEFLGSAVKQRYDRNSTPQQHIFKIVKVTGRTFYGYRSKEETFLRIYFYNPLIIRKVVDLLLSGNILSQKFQPYEAHIPYQLQFMIDFNLYGMNLIHYSDVKFRRKPGMTMSVSPISSYKSSPLFSSTGSGVAKVWDLSQLPETMFSSPALERNSVCELEIDVLACDIIVSSSTSGVRSCNPGIDAIWRDEMERRRQHEEQNWSQITIPDSQARVYKREMFPAEEVHMKILDEKLQASMNTVNQDNSLESSTNNFERVIQSSQVLTHTPLYSLSSKMSVDKNRTEQSEYEEDELFILLQELQKEKHELEKQAEEDKVIQLLEDAEEDLLDDVDAEKDDLVAEDENIWEQSFLCNTILDDLEEFTVKENEEKQVPLECPVSVSEKSDTNCQDEKNVFQGDGQGGESDSSSNAEEISTTAVARRSTRKGVVKPELKSTAIDIKKSGTPADEQTESPKQSGRLSLANRRKSAKLKSAADELEKSIAVAPAQPETPQPSGGLSLTNRRKSGLKTELKSTALELKESKTFMSPETPKSLGRLSRVIKNQSSIAEMQTSTQCSTDILKPIPGIIRAISSPARTSRRIAGRRTSSSSSVSTVSSHSEVEEGIPNPTDAFGAECINMSKENISTKPVSKTTNAIASPSTIARTSRRIAGRRTSSSSSVSTVSSHSEVQETIPKPKDAFGAEFINMSKENISTKPVSKTTNAITSPATIARTSRRIAGRRTSSSSSVSTVSSHTEVEEHIPNPMDAFGAEGTNMTKENVITKSVSKITKAVPSPATIARARTSRRIDGRRTSSSSSVSTVSSHSEVEETIPKPKDAFGATGTNISKENIITKPDSEVTSKLSPVTTKSGKTSIDDKSVKRGRGRPKKNTAAEKSVKGSNELSPNHLPVIILDRCNFMIHENPMKFSNIRKLIGSNVIVKEPAIQNISQVSRTKPKEIETSSESIEGEETNTSTYKLLSDETAKNIYKSSRNCKLKANCINLESIDNINANDKASEENCPQKTQNQSVPDILKEKQIVNITHTSENKTEAISKSNSIETISDSESMTIDLPQNQESAVIVNVLPESISVDMNVSCEDEVEDCIMQSYQDSYESLDEKTASEGLPINTSSEYQVEPSTVLLTSKEADEERLPLNDKGIETFETSSRSVAAPKIQLVDNGCQTELQSADVGLNTEKLSIESKEIGMQTDNIPFLGPLCKCQCVYIDHPGTKDETTDVQTDLTPPKRKHKHLQAESSAIRKSRKFENSSVSSEAPASPLSKNLAAISILSLSPSRIQRTPSVHLQTLSSQGNSPQSKSPSKHHSSSKSVLRYTPPSLQMSTSILNTSTSKISSPSSHKRTSTPVAYKSFLKQILRRKSKHHGINESLSERDDMTVDMSVNSIYEFSSPLLEKSLTEKDSPRKPLISLFEIKRSVSRSKAKFRRMRKTAAVLEANVSAPDVFQHEFEPMKQPPCFKSVRRWIKTQENVLKFKESESLTEHALIKVADSGLDMSSDEEVPENVRRCFGENESDSDDVNSSTGASFTNSKVLITQPKFVISNAVTPVSGASIITPKSILKMDSCRRVGDRAKRKIRFQDEASYKRFRLANVNEALPQQLIKEQSTENQELENPVPHNAANLSELDGLSPKNNFGFEHDMSNLQDAKALHQHQYLTTWSVEVHCNVRDDLLPDPTFDSIAAIFVFISNDVPDSFRKPKQVFKCLLTHPNVPHRSSSSFCEYYSTENELLDGFLQLYHDWDPDMLVGYEIEKNSWGYIIDRGLHLGRDMTQLLSRLLPKKKPSYQEKKDGSWDGLICGRIVLNLWNLLRHEITVQSYTYENAAYHILHRKVFRFTQKMLADLWNSAGERNRVFEYYEERVKGVIEIMETLDLINRTSELARLFGIQFYEVLSRGSQFRVESMMIRTAKPSNFIAVSPGVGQRAKMRAPEFTPLILEPQSNFYTDPVAVLDFQSLYPSMIIAYNYDYATVLGRVEHLGVDGQFELGCLETEVSPSDLHILRDHIHISPAGVAFVDASIRKGILPEMLEQILDTRQMVKRGMKKWKNEGATLQKVLDSRQLGLKLIANVTYGYTSANYSGRMPCVEIADSVVSKGRETLQRAIDLVKANHTRWGGEVLYGDTDSMFIRFPGRSRQEAFQLAQEIADEVTQSNPKPVKLKLEKIYQPCILQSKKRYVGYSYESADQKEPKYDAKGIETVRRDGCPAVKKILEKSLHILFTTKDPVKVQNFVQLQFKKLFTGRVSMKEYTFARAFRGRNGYKPGACVPSLEIAKKATELDPRAEPLNKERVPYVVIYGKPTLPLIQLVRTPLEFMSDYTMRLNAHYYIEKCIIPALNRCLVLAKMDASKWYKNLPRKYLRNILEENTNAQGTLDDYVHHGNCFRCDAKTEKGSCQNCDADIKKSVSYLVQMTADLGTKLETTRQICEMCSGDDYKCINMDCPVFPKLLRYERDDYFNRQLLSKLNGVEWS